MLPEETPVRRQVEWILDALRRLAAGHPVPDDEPSHFAENARTGTPAPTPRDRFWGSQPDRLGHDFAEKSSKALSDYELKVTLVSTDGREWELSCGVASAVPHQILSLAVSPTLSGFDARVATIEDAAALAGVERQSPVVLGDRSVTVDRGADYFAADRLMENSAVAIGELDGRAVGVFAGCVYPVRIGGVVTRRANGHRLRLLPEVQGTNVWRMLSGPMYTNLPGFDGAIAFIATENEASQRTHAKSPNKWTFGPLRCLIDTRQQAGVSAGGRATRADLDSIVDVLNECHADEEGFVPYTAESLAARLERAPELYSYGQLLMNDDAVVGVWPAELVVSVQRRGSSGAHRRALVLDYGFRAGCEDSLMSLIGAWCSSLSEHGWDELAVFTSPGSPGSTQIVAAATDIEKFDMWTYDVEEPQDAARRGWYTDPVYF